MKFEDLDLDGLEEIPEIPHEFEVDLHCVVVANHGFTMKAIDESEDVDIEKIERELADADEATVYSMRGDLLRFYDDLRQAARSLAIVALVTRLQHWIGRLIRRLKIIPSRGAQSTLANQLEALNTKLTAGPVPVLFFDELVTLRDSIVHNDSQAEWEFPKGTLRKIADRYRNAYGRVELMDEQVKEAIEKAIQQVKWYDEKMHPAPSSKP